MRPFSKKKAKQMREESAVRRAYLATHLNCEAMQAGAPGRCFGEMQVHEVLGRAQGGSTSDPENLKVVCAHHNTQLSQDVPTMRWGVEHGFRKRRMA